MGLTRIRAQQITDIDYKQAVRVATTGDVTLAGGAPTVVDGVTLVLDNRILVRAQSNAAQNGIYFVSTLGTGSDGTWTRTNDANQTGEIDPGMVVMVTEGDAYADTPWKLITNGEIVIGVTELTFEQFGGTASGSNTQIQFNNAGNFAGSANLTWNGTELYVNGAANVTGNISGSYFLGNANIQYTASSTEPTGNLIGAQWYNTSNDVLYEWQTDGTSNYWIDITGPVIGSNGAASGTTLTNGTSNISVALNSNATVNIGGTADIVVWSTTGEYVTGVVSATGNVNGSNLNATTGVTGTTVTATGNVTANNAVITNGVSAVTGSFSGNITGVNLISTGAVYSNYNTNTSNVGSFMATGGNTKGGTGYLDFLVAQNTSGGATNPYKWLRLNPTGGLEIINSAYTATLLTLTDAGAFSVGSTVSSTGFYVNSKQAVNGPAFRAYIDGSQTITSGSQQKVTFGSETFDTNSNFGSSRFTPTVEGYYQLNATVRISGTSGTGEVMITIWKNGSEYARGTNEGGTEQGANWYSMQVSDIAYANGSGDYFEIYIQQTSGGDRDTTSGQNISYFSGAMVRGA